MIGRTAAEINGKPIIEIMGAAGFQTIARFVERVLRGEEVRYETDVEFTGIGLLSLSVTYTPETDLRGEVTGWIASILDNTALKPSSARAGAQFDEIAAEMCESALQTTETSNVVPSPASDHIIKLPFTRRARSCMLIRPSAFFPLIPCRSNPRPLSSIRSEQLSFLATSVTRTSVAQACLMIL